MNSNQIKWKYVKVCARPLCVQSQCSAETFSGFVKRKNVEICLFVAQQRGIDWWDTTQRKKRHEKLIERIQFELKSPLQWSKAHATNSECMLFACVFSSSSLSLSFGEMIKFDFDMTHFELHSLTQLPENKIINIGGKGEESVYMLMPFCVYASNCNQIDMIWYSSCNGIPIYWIIEYLSQSKSAKKEMIIIFVLLLSPSRLVLASFHRYAERAQAEKNCGK